MSSAATTVATTLAPDTLATVRALVDRLGVYAVARLLGVDRTTVIRLLAGLPVRRGSVALIDRSLCNPALALAAPAITTL